MSTKTKTPEATQNWPELAIGLYDKLTGRGSQITYDFQNLEVDVPSHTGANAPTAHWKVNGQLRIRTSEEEASK